MKLVYIEVGIFWCKLGSRGLNLLKKKKIGGVRDALGEFGGVFELGICGYILFCMFLREAATLLLGMLLHRQCLVPIWVLHFTQTMGKILSFLSEEGLRMISLLYIIHQESWKRLICQSWGWWGYFSLAQESKSTEFRIVVSAQPLCAAGLPKLCSQAASAGSQAPDGQGYVCMHAKSSCSAPA